MVIQDIKYLCRREVLREMIKIVLHFTLGWQSWDMPSNDIWCCGLIYMFLLFLRYYATTYDI